MTQAHNRRILEQFRVQAETFTDDGFATSGLEWIVETLRPRPADRVLDVAAGAAHLGGALAPRVAQVFALDLTPEMLDQGRRLVGAAGLANVRFVRGDATALPWPDGVFDLVVCRITLHQVAEPDAVVREMVRVTCPDGRIGITDIVLTDPATEPENTRLERLRDPSHHRTLTPSEIQDLLAAAGATVVSSTARDNPVELEDWMARSRTPDPDRDEIRRRLAEELAGGPPTGLRPFGADQAGDGAPVGFAHRWATVVAVPGTAQPADPGEPRRS